MPLKKTNKHIMNPSSTAAANSFAIVPVSPAGATSLAGAASGAMGAALPAPRISDQMSALGLMTQLATIMAQTHQNACPGLQIFGGPPRAPRPWSASAAAAADGAAAAAVPPSTPTQTSNGGHTGTTAAADGHVMAQLEAAAAGAHGDALPDGEDDADTGDGKGKTGRGRGRGKGNKGKGKGDNNGKGTTIGKGKANKGKTNKGKANKGKGKAKGAGKGTGVMRRPSSLAANIHFFRRPAARPGLGCSKCRWATNGCTECKIRAGLL